MATDNWTGAVALFRNWPEIPSEIEAKGTLRRLRDALVGLSNGSTGWRDVVSLTRQILLEARARGNTTGFEVPLDPQLPRRDQWEALHCQTGPRRGGSHVYVTAEPWWPATPDATSRTAAEVDLQQVYLGQDAQHRRKFEPCSADPFWISALGDDHSGYVSVGQRQAARAVALASPGSTTIICLPTGHGKTAVAMAPALLQSKSSGVSVVVVPTSILAVDMERRTRDLLERQGHQSPTRRYAYTSGLSPDEKAEMRADIAAGRQRLVFTSPESLVRSLKQPLEDAAEAGLLQYFVIDEAHLVEQWGNSFRTEFQTMSSHRRTWLSKSPPERRPVTVAMSATLTAQQMETLKTLFAAPQGAQIVWAGQLRHEPSYYIDSCTNEEKREIAVLDAVSLLPKPMIVYTTKVVDAKEWADRLHARGMQRVVHVTGEANDANRREALEGWGGRTTDGTAEEATATRYDIVVGTSAFGLGIDLPDVKTIVHACLPETVDRYYQEVGRGGRDGSPSVAYLATTRQDEKVAEHINGEAIIGAPRALERWEAMWHSKTSVGDLYRLDLDSYPADMSVAYNTSRSWNVRILNLMVRAGLIRQYPPEPPRRCETESNATWKARLQYFYETANKYVDVELVDPQTNNPDHFRVRFESERNKLLRDQQSSLRELKAALSGNRCIGDVLGAYYRVPDGEGELRTGINCRGCPHCRATAQLKPNGFYRLAGEPRPLVPSPQNHGRLPLARYFGERQCLSLWWQEPSDRVLVVRLVEKLVRRGIAVVGGPGLNAHTRNLLQTTARTRTVILDEDGALLTSWPGPMVWLTAPDADSPSYDVGDRFAWNTPTYLIHPRHMRHPERPGTPLVDVYEASLSIRRALEEL